MLCFYYLFGKGEVKGWSNSSLQPLEGELQECWKQTLVGSGKQYKQEQWPQTGVGVSNWAIDETSKKIVPYFLSNYHHYSLWHMEMWEKSQGAVWDPLLQEFIDFGCFFADQRHNQSSSSGSSTYHHRQYTFWPWALGNGSCSFTGICLQVWRDLLWPVPEAGWMPLAGQVRSGHQNFWVAVAPLAFTAWAHLVTISTSLISELVMMWLTRIECMLHFIR